MDMKTTKAENFKDFKVGPRTKELKKVNDEKKPIVGFSSYAKSFPNWKNG